MIAIFKQVKSSSANDPYIWSDQKDFNEHRYNHLVKWDNFYMSCEPSLCVNMLHIEPLEKIIEYKKTPIILLLTCTCMLKILVEILTIV